MLSWNLKVPKLSASRTVRGSAFQTVGAATGKRRAAVLIFDAGTTSNPWFDERSVQTDTYGWSTFSGSQVDRADAL